MGPKLYTVFSLHLAQAHPHIICTKIEVEKAMEDRGEKKKREHAMEDHRHKDSRQEVILFPTTVRFFN